MWSVEHIQFFVNDFTSIHSKNVNCMFSNLHSLRYKRQTIVSTKVQSKYLSSLAYRFCAYFSAHTITDQSWPIRFDTLCIVRSINTSCVRKQLKTRKGAKFLKGDFCTCDFSNARLRRKELQTQIRIYQDIYFAKMIHMYPPFLYILCPVVLSYDSYKYSCGFRRRRWSHKN